MNNKVTNLLMSPIGLQFDKAVTMPDGTQRTISKMGIAWDSEKALEKVANGEYQIFADGTHINIAYFLKDKAYFAYDSVNNVFVQPDTFLSLGIESSMYANFGGNDDTLDFTNDGDLLHWDKSWTIGLTILIDPATTAIVDDKFITILQNGQNRILFRRDSGKGIYVSYAQTAYANGINTWITPNYGDKYLFIYDHTTRKLKIVNQHTIENNLNWNITVPTVQGNGEPDGTLSLGKSIDDVPNAWGSSKHVYYHGGMNNFIAMNGVMGAVDITAYFTVSSDVYFDSNGNPVVAGDYMESQSFYGNLTSYCALGEGTFPNVIDKKGLLTGGVMAGQDASFEPIPTL